MRARSAPPRQTSKQESSIHPVLKGGGLLLTAAVLWGGMFPVAKDALVALDPFSLNAIRYGATAIVFVVVLAFVEGPGSLRFEGRFMPALVFGSIGFAGFSLLAYAGLQHTQPEHGAIIMALQPMIAALMRWIWKGHRPPRITLACIAAAFAGVFLVVTRGSLDGLVSGTGFGDLLIVLGATSWVVYTLSVDRFAGWSALRFTTLTCLTGEVAIVLVTIAAIAAGSAHWPSSVQLSSVGPQMGYLIVFASVIAVLAWNAGIGELGALSGMLFINLVPITAFLIGVYQGRHFVPAELLGAALVIGALVVNNLALDKRGTRSSGAHAGPMKANPLKGIHPQ